MDTNIGTTNTLIEFIRSDFKNSSCLATAPVLDMAEILVEQKMASMVRWLSDSPLPPSLVETLAPIYKQNSERARAAQQFVSSLSTHCFAELKHFVLMKGMALSKAAYGSVKVRDFGDIDILIDKEDGAAFHNILAEMGFYQRIPDSSRNQMRKKVQALLFDRDPKRLSPKYPIKKYQRIIEYYAYYHPGSSDGLVIELQTGLHQMNQEMHQRFLWHTESLAELGCEVPNLEYMLLLLFVNAYENYKSFLATRNFSGVLRDYVDLHYYLKRNASRIDWEAFEDLLLVANQEVSVSVVLRNYEEIYPDELNTRILPRFNRKIGESDVSILESLGAPRSTRMIELKAIRKQWASSRLCIVAQAAAQPDNQTEFIECNPFCPVLFALKYSNDCFILKWVLPSSILRRNYMLMFQTAFHPLTDELEYMSYRIDSVINGPTVESHGFSLNRFSVGAHFKDGGSLLDTSMKPFGESTLLEIHVPYVALGITRTPASREFCVLPDVFKYHYGAQYHRIGGEIIDPRVYLIELI